MRERAAELPFIKLFYPAIELIPVYEDDFLILYSSNLGTAAPQASPASLTGSRDVYDIGDADEAWMHA